MSDSACDVIFFFLTIQFGHFKDTIIFLLNIWEKNARGISFRSFQTVWAPLERSTNIFPARYSQESRAVTNITRSRSTEKVNSPSSATMVYLRPVPAPLSFYAYHDHSLLFPRPDPPHHFSYLIRSIFSDSLHFPVSLPLYRSQ